MGKAELKIEIDEGLLAEAKAAGVHLASVIEAALRNAVGTDSRGVAAAAARQKADPAGAEARAKQWAEDNAEAIKAYGERIDREGCFGEEWRRW